MKLSWRVEQRLVASGDVDEHLLDGAPQHGLLLGHVHGHRVDVHEHRGEPGDLAAAGGRHVRQLHRCAGAGGRDLLDQTGEARPGSGRRPR
jgi:hypothetical protein